MTFRHLDGEPPVDEHLVTAGQTFGYSQVSRSVTGERLAMEDNVFAPSAVQRAILGLLDGGYTDRAIAGRLRVSERTVRGHIRALMAAAGKLGRFALGAEAARRGWL